MDYFGTTAPSGYMFADGSAISRTKYAELFAIIGTTYGAGDGSTTFNLPDKREAVTIMKSDSDTLGTTKGSNSISYTPQGSNTGTAITKAQLPSYDLYNASHTHTQNSHNHTQNSHNHTQNQHRHTVTAVNGTYDSNGSPLSGASYDAGVQGTQYSSYVTPTNNATTATNQATTATNQSTTIKVSSGGSGQTHNHTFTGTASTLNVMQKSLVCNYIIKVSNGETSAGEPTTPI